MSLLCKVTIFISVLSGLIGCVAPPPTLPTPQPTTPALGKTIVIGEISSDPAEQIEDYQPIADYLATHLKEFGIGTGTVKIAPDFETMINLLKRGEIDLVVDSPYPGMIISDGSGALPILRRWKGGVGEYHTVIFARKDSGLNVPSELKGKLIGYDERYSTTGYFLPTAHLLAAGLKASEKTDFRAVPAADEVGFIFSTSDENTIQWVLSNKVAAGATDSTTFYEIPESTRANLTILAETETAARHIVLARAELDPALVRAIKTLLIGLETTPEGKEILREFEKTSKFDELPPQMNFERMRELYKLVQGKK